MNKLPLEKLLKLAQQAALGAGQLLRQLWGKQFKVYHKGEVDLVTEVDLLSEKYIVKKLQSFSRQIGILAGSLIVQESGGKVSDFKGGKNYLYGDEILSSNGLIHEEMLAILQKYEVL